MTDFGCMVHGFTYFSFLEEKNSLPSHYSHGHLTIYSSLCIKVFNSKLQFFTLVSLKCIRFSVKIQTNCYYTCA